MRHSSNLRTFTPWLLAFSELGTLACQAEKLSFRSDPPGHALTTTGSSAGTAGAQSNSDDSVEPASYSAGEAGSGGAASATGTAGSAGAAGAPSMTVQRYRVEAFLLQDLETCATGDECSGDECVGFFAHGEERKVAFDPKTIKIVKPGHPLTKTAAKVHCFHASMSSVETQEMRQNLETLSEKFSQWTAGLIKLDLVFHELSLPGQLSVDGVNVWMSPLDAIENGLAARTDKPDLTLITHGVNDVNTGLHFSPAGCGMAYGAENGIAGGGFAWKPKTRGAYDFECSDVGGYAFQAHLQLHFGLTQLSGFPELNKAEYGACDSETPSPYSWFPAAGQCQSDPDYKACGLTECGDLLSWTEHVIKAHWDPNRKVTMSHCKDSVKNYDETDVDFGGRCAQ